MDQVFEVVEEEAAQVDAKVVSGKYFRYLCVCVCWFDCFLSVGLWIQNGW